jgi:hypothetical protein
MNDGVYSKNYQKAVNSTTGTAEHTRDRPEIRTLGDLWTALRKGEIDASKVRAWVEHGFVKMGEELRAVCDGYPESAQRAQQRYCEISGS